MSINDIFLILFVLIGGGWALWHSQADVSAYERSMKDGE